LETTENIQTPETDLDCELSFSYYGTWIKVSG